MTSLFLGRYRGASRAGERGLPTAGLFTFLVLVLVITPRMAAGPFIILGCVALISQKFRVRPPENWLASDGLVLALLAFSAYLFVNASWSLDLKTAYLKVGYFIVVLVLLYAALRWIAEAKGGALRIALTGVAIGAALASAYLLIELAGKQGLERWAFNLVPVLRPGGGKHINVLNGEVTGVGRHLLNRNAANLMLLFWPLALIAMARLAAMRLKIALGALAALWALVALISEHETSSIALLTSLAVFLVYGAWPAFGRRAVIAAWCASVALVVPAAVIAHKASLHQAEWLPVTARARIIIWDVTARNVLQAPILGIGIRSTRVLDAQNPNSRMLPVHGVYPNRTGRHAHNIYLQTWYELGAVGAGFLLIIGLLVLRGLSRLPAPLQPYAFSAATLICVLAAFSWGMWQSWYVSSLATGIIFLAMALRHAGDRLDQERRDLAQSGEIGR